MATRSARRIRRPTRCLRLGEPSPTCGSPRGSGNPCLAPGGGFLVKRRHPRNRGETDDDDRWCVMACWAGRAPAGLAHCQKGPTGMVQQIAYADAGRKKYGALQQAGISSGDEDARRRSRGAQVADENWAALAGRAGALAAGACLPFPARKAFLGDSTKPTDVVVSLNLPAEKLLGLRGHNGGPRQQHSQAVYMTATSVPAPRKQGTTVENGMPQGRPKIKWW